MIQIAKNGEEVILAAMHEYDTAQGDEKLIYAERMRAKIEAVLELCRIPDMYYMGQIREYLDAGYIKAGEVPEKPETHPMSPDDIANVDVIVKEPEPKEPETEADKRLKEVSQMMEAGRNIVEIANLTGRSQRDVLADMKKCRRQKNK